jgi:hypothetical protein
MTVPNRPVSGSVLEAGWGQVAHDTAVAQDIQLGTASISVVAGAFFDATVTFPRPFAAPPTIALGHYGAQTFGVGGLLPLATATSFKVRMFKNGGSLAAGEVVTFQWIAIGPRA